jgi:hypothetical protein
MKRTAIIFTALSLLTLNAFAGLSAQRLSHESFHQAKTRSHGAVLFSEDEASDLSGSGPESLARPMNQLKIADIPAVESYDQLVAQFKFIRDSYFLKDGMNQRRLTWLYPDDGCYARAELAAENLILKNAVTPKKVFAFGELHASTKNAPNGWVEWWYHVAVTYRVGNTAYVLDPALDPHEPMTLTEWNNAIGGDSTGIKYAICSKDAFDPDSTCVKPPKIDEEMAEHEQRAFLPDEWNRLLDLGRNPEKELGSQPPWL